MANGAATQGIQFGLRQGTQSREIEQREREAAIEKRQQLVERSQEAIAQAFTDAQELIAAADERGFGRDHPSLQRALQAEFTSAVQTAQKARETLGSDVGTPSPQQVASKFRSMLALQSKPEERAEQAADKTRAKAKAKAEGKAAGTPDEPQTATRVVSGDSPLNQKFSLGIPEGESARVEFTMDEQGQPTVADVKSGFGGGDTTVNVGGVEGLPSWARDTRNQLISEGRSAVFTSRDLTQLSDLIADPATQTGSLQPALTGLQGIADDMGVDLSSVASSMGIELGNLENKEEFGRIAKRLIIDGFEKFKGNLNRREVELAVDAFQNLGRSEEANIEAIASGMAAQEIARQRALDATQATTQEEISALQRELLKEDSGRFQELKDKFAKEIREKRAQAQQESAPRDGTDRALPEGIPEGSTFLQEQSSNGTTKQFYRSPNGDILVFERVD